jgi:hypothetical protein
MNKNIGSLDRILRVVLGLSVLGAGYYFKSWLGLIGLVPLLTALVSFCPLYPLVGISTCKRPEGKN